MAFNDRAPRIAEVLVAFLSLRRGELAVVMGADSVVPPLALLFFISVLGSFGGWFRLLLG